MALSTMAKIMKLEQALSEATQPSVRKELKARIAKLEGGTSGGAEAFADAEALAEKRRKAAARRGLR